MSATIKRVGVVVLISLCAISLSFHFAVESVGGIEKHLAEGQGHDGDYFVMVEHRTANPVQLGNWFPSESSLYFSSRPLTPLFEPPKSI